MLTMVIDLNKAGIYEFENSCLHLLLDEPARLLYSSWVCQPTSAEYREATGLFIRYLQEKDIAYWISDTTNLNDLSREDLQWVLEELIPAVNASALQKIARITVEDTNLETFMKLASPHLTYYRPSIKVEQFPNYREAVSWIESRLW